MDALSKIFDDIHLNKSEYIYIKAQGEWSFSMREQNAVIAHIILMGSAHFKIDANTSLTAQAGDIVLIPSGNAHHGSHSNENKLIDSLDISNFFKGHRNDAIEIGTQSPESALVFTVRCHIDTLMARPLLNALPSYIHIHHAMSSTGPEWLRVGLYFVALETQRIQPGRDKIFDHLMTILLIECVRDYITQLDDQSSWLNALSHPELSNALAAIHGSPEQPWTVETLAEQCCMSRSKFANLFQSIIQETPLAYLQQHRLRLASQLLRESNLTIQKIANNIGYSSETAFSQAFKRQFDLSPKQYRQNYLATIE
ncbi:MULTISPECIES: AraC family transcriptional regulator [unclassified Acinetobacter]|uniref:AraC family transcriptional regulator n=1 Tax=unclassified Acinetobacter TaxID=196816 RepID=UPI001909C6C0|nr:MULTISPECIES: AraC family transcriptional regulator [unclassified Acinetobacter]MBK0063420.1 AraC family transcriptional regulator [Acinetobacter sp. S55]MBK0066668.1 AraC family transcriptional regulator [Acinetobacter sp. S54]